MKLIYVLTIFFIIYAYNPMFGSSIGFKQGLIDSLRSYATLQERLEFLDMYINAPAGALTPEQKAIAIELKNNLLKKRV